MKAKALRAYLLAGLVVWLPILLTFGVLRFIVDLLDETLSLLPHAYQPMQLLGMRIPGLGVLLSLGLLITTGIIATNFLGQHLVAWGESILARIPLVRTIYNAAKQVINAILSSNGQAFRKVVLVQYPRVGMWTIAFVTGSANQDINLQTGDTMLAVFIPTTPIPTSGFIMMVAQSEVKEVAMTVDEALKFIISMGVMQPQSHEALAQNNIKKVAL